MYVGNNLSSLRFKKQTAQRYFHNLIRLKTSKYGYTICKICNVHQQLRHRRSSTTFATERPRVRLHPGCFQSTTALNIKQRKPSKSQNDIHSQYRFHFSLCVSLLLISHLFRSVCNSLVIWFHTDSREEEHVLSPQTIPGRPLSSLTNVSSLAHSFVSSFSLSAHDFLFISPLISSS